MKSDSKVHIKTIADNIRIRKGKPEDAKHFSRLILFAGSRFALNLFGFRVRSLMENLFRHRKNYFSFEDSYFLEIGDEIAGMGLVYDYTRKKRMKFRFALLLLRYLKWELFAKAVNLLKSERIMGHKKYNECYLSNFAIYPKFRGRGFGARLLGLVEEEARRAGNQKIVLDVAIDNKKAITLYERMGYNINTRTPLVRMRGKTFEFFKMSKTIVKQERV